MQALVWWRYCWRCGRSLYRSFKDTWQGKRFLLGWVMWHFKLKASWLNCLSFRIGKQKKFADQEVKEVRDAASSFMSKAKLNLHENVPEFDEDNPQCFEIKFVTVHKTPSDNLSKNFFSIRMPTWWKQLENQQRSRKLCPALRVLVVAFFIVMFFSVLRKAFSCQFWWANQPDPLVEDHAWPKCSWVVCSL